MKAVVLAWMPEHQQLIKWAGFGVLVWLASVTLVFAELTPEQTATVAAAISMVAVAMTVEAAGAAFGAAAMEAVPAIAAAMGAAAATGGVVGAINLVALGVVVGIGLIAVVGLAAVVVVGVHTVLQQQMVQNRGASPARSQSGEQTDFTPPSSPFGDVQGLIDLNDDGSLGPRGFHIIGPRWSGGSIAVPGDPNAPGSIGGGLVPGIPSTEVTLSPVDGLPGLGGDIGNSPPGAGFPDSSSGFPDAGAGDVGGDTEGWVDGRCIRYADGSPCTGVHHDGYVHHAAVEVSWPSALLLLGLGLGAVALRRRWA